MNVVDRFVERGTHCVDIGAHLGIYTHLFLRLVGSKGQVTAIEPQTDLVNYLERAFAPEIQYGRVQLLRTALGEQPGESTLSLPRERRSFNRGRASLARHDADALQMAVPVHRLDDLGLEGVGFVKCDVEGFELAVLRGAAGVLSGSAPVLLVEIEERHAGKAVPETFRYLEGHGYRTVIYRETDGAFATVSPGANKVPRLAETWVGRYVNNYFFVPDGRSHLLADLPLIG